MLGALAEGQPPKVGMISLGCAKNLVDAEIMLGSARAGGFEITSDASQADVLVVNTCGFIESAKQESIDAILSARQRPEQKLIVSGCLAQRYQHELARELPEVDAFVGLDEVASAGEIFRRVLSADQPKHPLVIISERSRYVPDFHTARLRLTPSHLAYVKIAEGCNHPCSFCVIPQMRGRHRSRTVESVVAEVRNLVSEGVKEVNLISQDTTYFGMDLWPEKAGPRQPVDPRRGPTVVRLLDELASIEGEFWIRLLYTHPAHWSDELIVAIARNPKVARYVDMPLQHIHGEMLGAMRRETSREHIEDLICHLRAGIPGLAIRTTFIVGFPGETEEHFSALIDFIEATRFERLGIFRYSQEEGSRAARMSNQLPVRIKNRRYREAMQVQQRIAAEIAAAQKGATVRVLVDQPRIARSQHDAPEVDCRVVLKRSAPVGEFIDVRITGSQVYDLLAETITRATLDSR